MTGEAAFRRLASGTWRGPVAAGLRSVLAVLEWPYAAAVRRRNRRFDLGHTLPARAAAPVISVGNLTVGGTGKTPLVAWLGAWLEQRHIAATIISRGYGARA